MDSRHFEQLRSAVELVRYPRSGTTPVPDLMLVGVDAPFVVNGSDTGHFIALAGRGGSALVGDHLCVSWDLRPDPDSPTDGLHVETATTIAVPPSPPADLEMIWWINSDLTDPTQGVLLTQNDLGSGCFRQINGITYLTAVHAGTPSMSHDGTPNADAEAYSTSVAPIAIQEWMDGALFGVQSSPGHSLAGHPGFCSRSSDELELFALGADARMIWLEERGWPGSPSGSRWRELGRIDPPTVPLSPERPAALCFSDGTRDLFAVAEDHSVWWLRFRRGAWALAWEPFDDTVYATSGLSTAAESPQKSYLVFRGSRNECQFGRYLGGTWSWTDLAGVLSGPPVLRLVHSEYWDVYARAEATIFDRYIYYGSNPGFWIAYWEGHSDPAVVSWRSEDAQVFTRSDQGRLWWYAPSSANPRPRVELNLSLPNGALWGVTRGRGMFELFVTEPGKEPWYAAWPRRPGG